METTKNHSGNGVAVEEAAPVKEAISGLSSEGKKEVATAALRDLPTGATDVRRKLATETVETLPTEDTKKVVAAAMQTLPPRAQDEIIGLGRGPTQIMTDRIWLIIVSAFVFVFVGGTAALVAAVFTGEEEIQILVTVFTTVAGVLAGFVSGRASSGERNR